SPMGATADTCPPHEPPQPGQGASLADLTGHPRGPGGARLSVVVVDDVSALAGHLPAWESLAAAAVEPNGFYGAGVLLPAAQCFGGGRRLLFVLVFAHWQGGPSQPPLLCGFFPLERRRGYHGLPVRYLTLWKWVHCYLCTPLVRAGYARACLEAFF